MVKHKLNNTITEKVFISMEEIDGDMYMDQKGAFPQTSNRGLKYFMVVCTYNVNQVIDIPMKSF